MIVKTIQWNIGGGKIRKEDAPIEGPYPEEGIEHIKSILKTYHPDIITLQETHADEKTIQANILAEYLHFPHVVNDVYDKSHLEAGQGLGQAILSRFPIRNHQFSFFINPYLKTTRPDGETWISHDKGVSRCEIQIEYKLLEVATLHMVPFRKFDADPTGEAFTELRKNLTALISPTNDYFLLQGDFNFDDTNVKKFLPDLFHGQMSEVPQTEPTTPKGRRYDHILFQGMKCLRSEVITEVRTDHFPIYSEFEI